MLLLLLLLLVLLYYYLTRNHDYWAKRNVKYERPIPLFGNMYRNVMGKQSSTELTSEMYYKYPDEKVVGMYRGTTPELIIRDLEVVRKIMVVDFAYFYPRGIGPNPNKEPLFENLFHADGDPWRLLRQRLSSVFTTAKLKKMFPLIIECAAQLQNIGEAIVSRGGECNVRELMACFGTDFIAACGFGLQVDSIRNENSLFRSFGKQIFDRNRSWRNIALVIIYDLLPDFRTLAQSLLSETMLLNTTTNIVETVLANRNNRPSGRHDFIDLLLEMAEKGKIMGESIENRNQDGSPIQVEMEITLRCMVAQVFLFFAAGFETTSSSSSYLLHELAYHPEEQKKIQIEIDGVLAKYNNKICYDSIAEMTALSMAFKEAMRKFPSFGTINRECAKRYTIPELGITLDPGVKIAIPVQAIQMDEKYFENPLQFKPERFKGTLEERPKYSYMPFGAGPRMCVGARLGEMQSLAGLVSVLQKFTVEPGPASKKELEVSHISNIVQSIKGGIPLRLKLRDQSIDIKSIDKSKSFV